MNYIIFDLEWNQPVNSKKSAELPHGEIIQIGFISTDADNRIRHRGEIMIKPSVYTVMNAYVSGLTGITQEDIDSGISFREAIEEMSRFFVEDTVLITWGDDDIPILCENLRFHGMDETLLPPHYNLQRIFASQTGSNLRQTGLKTAAEALGIVPDEEIRAHDALNDAYMTYLIAKALDLPAGIERYDRLTAEITANRPAWETEKPLFALRYRFTKNPSAMAGELRRLHFCCPWCGKDFFGTEPVRQGKNSFVSVGKCQDQDELFFRFSLKEGFITAAAFHMTDELGRIYQSRIKSREKREKRRELFRKSACEERKKKDND